ncbi:MAG: helix-turn-helix domain-containing protein [Clostridia bacterium]|nr:helix-turn-helix domain-containing protein [Clostridia bacterium]
MAREKAAFRDVMEMLNVAFPGVDVLTLVEVTQYLRMDRRTLLQDDEFPAVKVAGKYLIHKAPLARWLAA